MNRRQISVFNVFALTAIVINWILGNAQLGFLGSAIYFLVGVYIILAVPGVNIVYLTEKITRRRFDEAVFISLALLSSLILAPFVIVAVFKMTNYVDRSVILTVYLSFLSLPLFWDLFTRLIKDYRVADDIGKFAVPKIKWRNVIFHPITIVLVIAAVGCLYNLTRYEFLATPDSYSWLIEFENEIPNNNISTTFNPRRISFTALIASFFYVTDVSLFTLFKYVLPFLSLLAVPATWLAGRELSGRVKQTVFMLAAVLVSPTVLLELEYARQQTIFLLFLYFAVGLSVYAVLRNDKTIFYLMGGLAFLGVTFHAAFAIFVLAWITAYLLSKWRFLRHYQFVLLLLAVIGYLLLRDTSVGDMCDLIIIQVADFLMNLISGNWNMQFPAQYSNVDRYEMGWGGLAGVVKYYAYYAGPVSLFVLFALIPSLIFRRKLFRNFRVFLTNKCYLGIFILLLLFFFIAEVAPRFANIAYLPDRAWQYLGILLILVLFILLSSARKGSRKIVTPLLILSAGVSFAGAVYVNQLTKYTIPDYELTAAKWIKQNIGDSYFFASTSKNLLRYHADRRYVYIHDSTYTFKNQQAIIQNLFRGKSRVQRSSTNMDKVVDVLEEMEETAARQEKLLTEKINDNKVFWDVFDETETALSDMRKRADDALLHTNISEEYYKKQVAKKVKSLPVYIYYAKTHPNNPYSGRPYKSSFTTTMNVAEFPALDQKESIFTRVYEDRDKVIIWKVDTEQL